MVIFVMGLPGTGKTYFAKALAEKLNVVHVNSDITRHEMNMRGKYDMESRRLVYQEMQKRMYDVLLSGRNVVVDATFYNSSIRDNFFSLVSSFKSDQSIVLMTASDETIHKRMSSTRPDSEADYQTYLKLKAMFQLIKEDHLVLPSDQLQLNEMIEKTIQHFNLKG